MIPVENNRQRDGEYPRVVQRSIQILLLLMRSIVILLLFPLPRLQADNSPRQRIVVVKTRDMAFYNPTVDAFTRGLKSRGYDTDKGIKIVVVALSGKADQDTALVRDQLANKPQLVVTLGTDATLLLSKANSTVPVLFSMVLDPVSLGVVKSLDSPGGNFSGTTLLVSPGKQIDALLQAAPLAHRIGVLYTEGDRTSLAMLEEARQDAKRLSAEIVAVAMTDGKQNTKQTLDQLQGKVDALWLIPDPASSGSQALIDTMDFAKAHHLPVLGASSGTVRNGALLALSANLQDLGDNTAEMAARILDGNATPAQMRVRGPRRTTLSLNLEAARSLQISISDSVLHLADEVIDAHPEGKAQ
jgi:putative ABC transport system substrate-binding protein